MTRKNRSLFIALIALAAAAAALIAVKKTGKESETIPEKQDKTIILSDVPVEDLRSVILERGPQDTLQLYSNNGTEWLIDDVPEHFRVKDSSVYQLVRSLARMRSFTQVEPNAAKKDLKDFGLRPPRAAVTLRDKDGGETLIEIGIPSPSGAGFFARKADSQEIALLSSMTAESVFTTKESLRDMSLPAVQPQKLTGFSYRYGNVRMLAEPAGRPHAFSMFPATLDIVAPFQGRYPLDNSELAAILNEEYPLPLEAREYLDNLNPEDPQLGLDPETADKLYMVDSDSGVLSLIIGASDGRGRRYAMLGDREDSVFLLDEKDVGLITVDPFRLLNKFVFLGSITKMSRIKVEQGNQTWILKREEFGEPDEIDDDQFTINNTRVEPKDFANLYQKFIGIRWEGQAEKQVKKQSPEIRITVTHSTPGVEKMVVRFWPYDKMYYLVNAGNQPIEFLAGRYQVERFIEDMKALAALTG